MSNIVTLKAGSGQETAPNRLYLYELDLNLESEDKDFWYGVPVLVCCSYHLSHPVGKLPYSKQSWSLLGAK